MLGGGGPGAGGGPPLPAPRQHSKLVASSSDASAGGVRSRGKHNERVVCVANCLFEGIGELSWYLLYAAVEARSNRGVYEPLVEDRDLKHTVHVQYVQCT